MRGRQARETGRGPSGASGRPRPGANHMSEVDACCHYPCLVCCRATTTIGVCGGLHVPQHVILVDGAPIDTRRPHRPEFAASCPISRVSLLQLSA